MLIQLNRCAISVMTAVCISLTATYSPPLAAAPTCTSDRKKALKLGLERFELNAVSETQLMEIPRIGIKTARAIVDHRKTIGGIKSMEQLRRVRGVGDKSHACLLKYTYIAGK